MDGWLTGLQRSSFKPYTSEATVGPDSTEDIRWTTCRRKLHPSCSWGSSGAFDHVRDAEELSSCGCVSLNQAVSPIGGMYGHMCATAASP